MTEKKKRNYPKQRKPRDTSYSMTHYILKNVGKEQLYEIWKENGHHKTAEILTEELNVWVTSMVIQYIAQRKFGWTRVITDKSLPMSKAVLSGKVDPSYYRTIIFKFDDE